MADVSVTPENVFTPNGAVTCVVSIGGTVDAGDVIRYDQDNDYWVRATNLSAAGAGSGNANWLLFALSSGTAGQQIAAVEGGNIIKPGSSALSPGRMYILSADGAFSLEADVTSLDFLTVLGYAISPTELFFQPISTNVQA